MTPGDREIHRLNAHAIDAGLEPPVTGRPAVTPDDIVRHVHGKNAHAVALGGEPPIRLTWHVHSDVPGIGRPTVHIDDARMRAFTRLLYELEQA